MKLFLFDPGDPTVGIFPQTFEIDCPFEREDADANGLEEFRKEIVNLFDTYDVGVKAQYDFELKALALQENELYAASIEGFPELFVNPPTVHAYTPDQLRELAAALDATCKGEGFESYHELREMSALEVSLRDVAEYLERREKLPL